MRDAEKVLCRKRKSCTAVNTVKGKSSCLLRRRKRRRGGRIAEEDEEEVEEVEIEEEDEEEEEEKVFNHCKNDLKPPPVRDTTSSNPVANGQCRGLFSI